MEVGSSNPVANAVVGTTKAKEVEQKETKVSAKPASGTTANLPVMPNPAEEMKAEEQPQDGNLMNAFSHLLKEIDSELKNQIAANIKRASKEEISPKAREHLKTAFDHLKTVHKQVQEMASQIG